MKRRLMIEVDAGEKTCDGCDRCNIDKRLAALEAKRAAKPKRGKGKR